MGGRVCAGIARTWLDRRSWCRDRVPLGRGTRGAVFGDRDRVCPAQGRCHRHVGNPGRYGLDARDVSHSDSVRDRGRPGWQQTRRQPARPGGNVTGLSVQSADIAGKRLELLHEVVPGLRRLAVIGNVGNEFTVLELGQVKTAAATLGLEFAGLEIRRSQDIVPALETLKGRAQALYVCVDGLASTNRIRINILAAAARLPTMHGSRDYVEAGGLLSYGANYPDLFRRAAGYVDKVLRGVKPGDIPVEQPTKFDLVVNLTVAKALGLDVPSAVLARADEVIE